PGTRCFQGRPARAASTAPSATSRNGCRTYRAWDSTSCTSRPSTPSAARTARARTTTPWPGPTSPEAPGPSAPEGGHKSVHPQLGTLDDFRRLLKVAGEHGLSIALDIAFQCSPD